MADLDFDGLAGWFEGLAAGLDAPARRRLATRLGRELRASQSARIGRQEDPDGQAFAPRSQPPYRLRRKVGAIKGKMFRKLRQASHLKASATADEIAIGFTGRDADIAATSQYGLRDKVGRGIVARYPVRRLLGLTEAEKAGLLDQLIETLSG